LIYSMFETELELYQTVIRLYAKICMM